MIKLRIFWGRCHLASFCSLLHNVKKREREVKGKVVEHEGTSRCESASSLQIADKAKIKKWL